jgi:hypothetical protein
MPAFVRRAQLPDHASAAIWSSEPALSTAACVLAPSAGKITEEFAGAFVGLVNRTNPLQAIVDADQAARRVATGRAQVKSLPAKQPPHATSLMGGCLIRKFQGNSNFS